MFLKISTVLRNKHETVSLNINQFKLNVQIWKLYNRCEQLTQLFIFILQSRDKVCCHGESIVGADRLWNFSSASTAHFYCKPVRRQEKFLPSAFPGAQQCKAHAGIELVISQLQDSTLLHWAALQTVVLEWTTLSLFCKFREEKCDSPVTRVSNQLKYYPGSGLAKFIFISAGPTLYENCSTGSGRVR